MTESFSSTRAAMTKAPITVLTAVAAIIQQPLSKVLEGRITIFFVFPKTFFIADFV